MPLHVVAYQSLQPLFAETDEKLNEFRQQMFVVKDPKLVALSKHPIFPERADYFPSGFFRSTGEVFATSLGTHSNYASFKNGTADAFAGRSLSAIFEEPSPGPFFELLYFKENPNRTIIGPKTSEKLVRDFADHRSQAEGLGGSFFERYKILNAAFELASRSGAVCFDSSL
jgi:hypothetical protein